MKEWLKEQNMRLTSERDQLLGKTEDLLEENKVQYTSYSIYSSLCNISLDKKGYLSVCKFSVCIM